MKFNIKNILYNSADYTINRYLRYRRSIFQMEYEKSKLSSYISKGKPLTSEEKKEIKQKWGILISSIYRGYAYYIGLKELDTFNPNYLSSSYYSYFEPIFNPPRCKPLIGHKSLTALLYPNIEHPETIVRSIGGNLFDNEYHPISTEKAIHLINNCTESLLLKPAVDFCQGEGIKKFDMATFQDLSNIISTKSIFEQYSDFILQKITSQSSDTAKFNPSSLNCFRITTLNMNGNVSICSRALKCGPQNSIVDNIGEGKRGVIVGINPAGILDERGFYGNGEVTTNHNGITFSGQQIKHFSRVEEAALKLHEISDECKLIGWDIALNEQDQPILIEGNVKVPGIALEQMCSGPIFGERTDEVIHFLKSKMK